MEGENSLIKQVKEWKELKVGNETQHFLILNLHRLEQKIWGDFKVQFKSRECSFYFWLNVSAILYNNELRKITEIYGYNDKPIHFNEFEEIEETDKLDIKNLLLPENHSKIL